NMMTASWRPALVALNLLLLTMIAYFAARIVTSGIASRLERPVAGAAPATAVAAAVPQAQPEAADALSYQRDVFSAVKGAPEERAPSDAKRSDLNVKLWGTAIAHDPSQSYAIIEAQAARRQSLYRVGDTILDTATLVRVEWDRVVLERNGE